MQLIDLQFLISYRRFQLHLSTQIIRLHRMKQCHTATISITLAFWNVSSMSCEMSQMNTNWQRFGTHALPRWKRTWKISNSVHWRTIKIATLMTITNKTVTVRLLRSASEWPHTESSWNFWKRFVRANEDSEIVMGFLSYFFFSGRGKRREENDTIV